MFIVSSDIHEVNLDYNSNTLVIGAFHPEYQVFFFYPITDDDMYTVLRVSLPVYTLQALEQAVWENENLRSAAEIFYDSAAKFKQTTFTLASGILGRKKASPAPASVSDYVANPWIVDKVA